jgi:hypothetical protein
MKMQITKFGAATIIALGLGPLVMACSKKSEEAPPPATREAAAPAKPGPVVSRHPSRVYWGDTHLHTALSMDAAAVGAKLGPADAYRFARGEEVTSSTGQKAKLSRPLDFLVVTDHAEAIGAFVELMKGNEKMLANPTLKRWRDMIQAGGDEGLKAAWEIIRANSSNTLPDEMKSPELVKSTWDGVIKAAEQFNEPGRFTAFIGYEYTSMPGGNNLHRNVIFRDGGDKASQTAPFSALDSENVEDLWKVLAAYEEKTGGKVLAIPHNGNVSGGLMFAQVDFMGNPLTRKYAEDRAKWEPLFEATQQKGDSESHPFLSPEDEFADYEDWDKMNLNGNRLHEDSWYQFEYARAALKNGLKLEQELGANPFKFGMVGSTDAHGGVAAVAENNFFGKAPPYEPSPHRTEHVFTEFKGKKVMAWELGASGYAGVWATDNTREALWDAMKRKEVYASTGPRMTVRFFAGWDYADADAKGDIAVAGYAKGGDLTPLPSDGRGAGGEGKPSPTFLIAAMKDPDGANLDRYQIVKGWLDKDGKLHEKVYDVAWSGERKPGADGKLPAVGNTVNVADASYTNDIGAPELVAVWKDPAFDPAQRAFYYGRVIEIPTPRWTAYDAKRFKLKMAKDVRMITQERAYTSPIWYTPG